jgi:hypothetical protein
MGNAKPKAVLTITLRNNDRIRVVYAARDGSGMCGYVKTWREVEKLLEGVMPVAERRRRADAKSQRANHATINSSTQTTLGSSHQTHPGGPRRSNPLERSLAALLLWWRPT